MSSAAYLAILLAAQGGGRIAPPAEITCDRNRLTVYAGQVADYSRKASDIRLTILTDWDTKERVALRAGDKVLLQGKPITADGWRQVEVSEGKLLPRVRAAAWICEGDRPVLDWQPPAQP